MRKITLITYFFDGGVGGNYLKLMTEFSSRGYDVDLIYVRGRPDLIASVPPNVRLIKLKVSIVPAMLFGLVRYFSNSERDAVLVSGDIVNAVAVIAKIFARRQFRLVLNVHHVISENAKTKTGVRRWAKPAIVRLTYPYADAIVAVSDGIRDEMQALLGMRYSKIFRIYNPIFTDEIHQLVNEEIFHPWFEDTDVPTIITVGRLSKEKDHQTLISAVSIANQQQPVRLLIIGGGSLKAELEDLIPALDLEERVELLGFIENPFPYLAKSDLFVLSSRYEGFGNVLVESLAVGTPVVSTDCKAGPREILADGRFGTLVPVGDASALAEAILSKLNKKCEASCQKALISRAKAFSVQTSADEYERVLSGTEG